MKKAISVFLHLFLHLVFFFNIYFCINMLVEVWSDGKLAWLLQDINFYIHISTELK